MSGKKRIAGASDKAKGSKAPQQRDVLNGRRGQKRGPAAAGRRRQGAGAQSGSLAGEGRETKEMTELRQRAEAIQKRTGRPATEVAEDVPILVHELQTRQMELEMQNEELRRAQQELQVSQAELDEERYRYQTLFDLAPEGYLVTDVRGRIHEANVAACRLLGQERERLLEAALPLFFAEPDVHVVAGLVAEAREGRSIASRGIEVSVRQGDRAIECEVTVNEVKRTTGQIVGLRWLLHDITQRRRTEALRRSEERFRAMFESSPMAMALLGLDGRLIDVNPAAVELHGFETREELIGRDWLELVAPEYRATVQANWERVLREGEVRDLELVQLRKDGQRINTLVSTRRIHDTADKPYAVLAMVQDVTEQKRAEADLRRRNELSEAVSRIGQLLHSTLETREVIKRIVEEGSAVLGNETAAISERKDGGWLVRYVQGMPAEMVGLRLEDEQEKHAVLAIETREVVAVEDGFDDERFNREHLRRHNVRSVLVAPLVARGAPFGVLFFNYHKATHAFSEAELHFARQLAAAASSALGNAELFEERKRMEERLTEQARLLALTNDAILVRDTEDRIVYWNKGAEDLYGFSREEAVGRVSHELLRTEFPEPPERIRAKLLRSGRWEGELKHARRDGRRIITFSRWALDRDAKGRPAGVLETNNNMTERRRAEEALRKSYARTERILGSITDAFFAVDFEWRFTYVNGEAERLLRRPARELLGGNVWELFVGAEAFRRRYEEALASHQSVHFEEFYEGLQGWFEVHAYPSSDGLSVYFRDVSERRRTAEALRQAHQRLEYHARNTPLAVIEFDSELRVRAWNEGARRVFGWEASEVLGRHMWEVPWTHEEDRAAVEKVSAGLATGQTLQSFSANRNVRKDGRVIWCEWYNSSLTDKPGQMQSIQSLVLDVTERKEFEAELQRLVDERTMRLQELVGELEHFSYTITHDMRAPLRAMRGFGELVRDLCSECEHKERLEFIGKIMTSAARMDRLITDALDYSRSVRQELPLEDVDLEALLRGMLDTYPELQTSKARIQVEGRLPSVLGNEAGLTQCLSNLLGNAVKFVKPGQTPEMRIWAELVQSPKPKVPGQDGEWVRIWVEDKGIGIPKEMLPRVFDMFSRGSHSFEGTGIGLALVRKVMQRMGGRVGVQSEAGLGSRFWLELRVGEKPKGL